MNGNGIQEHTIIVFSEDKPGVLYRIAGIFVRRKINVEKLFVKRTKTPNVSRFVINVHVNEDMLNKLINQINRIVEVLDVFEKKEY